MSPRAIRDAIETPFSPTIDVLFWMVSVPFMGMRSVPRQVLFR